MCRSVARRRRSSEAWKANPASGDWRDAANWTLATVPNSETDVATFDDLRRLSRARTRFSFVATQGSIGAATFLNNPAAIADAEGGWTEIDLGTCAGTNFIANGATVAGPQAGQVYPTAGAVTLTSSVKAAWAAASTVA